MGVTDQGQSGIVPAGGTLRLRFTPNARQSWIIQQCSVNGQLPGAVAVGPGATCNLFLDTLFVAVLSMPQDVGSGQPYVTVNNGRTFLVVVAGAVVGSSVQATILYDDGQGSDG